MNNYETIMIVNPNLTEEVMDGVIEKIKKLITDNNGSIEKTEVWGKRKLAYPVKKHNEGYYVLIEFSSDSNFIDELQRVYNITDEIIKHIVVKKD